MQIHYKPIALIDSSDDWTQMNNIRTKVSVTAILLAINCNFALAANKVAPTSVVTSTLSHKEILTQLLIADLAMQRDMPELALENYIRVAKSTHNTEVAQLATEVAIQTSNLSQAINAAEIWAQDAPKDLQAQLIATTLLVSTSPDKASKYLINAFDAKSVDIDQQLLVIMSKLSTTGQTNLANTVFKIAEQRKKDP